MVPGEMNPLTVTARPSVPIALKPLPAIADEPPQHGPVSAHGPLHHRVREVAWHIPWYGFKTQARLARDARVAPSTISRLLRGHELPSLVVALRLTQAISKRAGRSLEVRELFSLDGSYPTPSVCALMGCRQCTAPTAFDRDDNVIEGSRNVEAGQWSRAANAKGAK